MWVLIFVIYNSGVSTGNIEFTSKVKCENAENIMLSKINNGFIFCTPK